MARKMFRGKYILIGFNNRTNEVFLVVIFMNIPVTSVKSLK